ncbi:MAG: YvcK family protein [Gemmatimonadota bacterium]|nr:YvcK family protein [Gemmatimonadota bacterium]
MKSASSSRLKIVTIGGGTGSSILLRGLKRYAYRLDITAIVTVFDDGGSSGRLSEEFGVPALGDIRRCIAALLPESEKTATLDSMLGHRFTSGGPLNDHSLGNMMLLGVWQKYGSLARAVEEWVGDFGLLGDVIPVSDRPARVCAILEDGTMIRGETQLGAQNQALFGSSHVYLEPRVAANSAALEALDQAQIVVLCPGDLFTSVIPNLLPEGVSDALNASSAKILQVSNTTFKSGEDGGYVASDFVATVNRYLNSSLDEDFGTPRGVDAMIVNVFDPHSAMVPDAIPTDARIYEQVETVLSRSLSHASDRRVHDADKLGAAVMEYVDAAISQH